MYIVGRADVLCAQLLILAFHLYAPSSAFACSLLRLMLALVLVVVAGLCKETGFTFFGLLVIWEVLVMTRRKIGGWNVAGACGRVAITLLLGSLACYARYAYTGGTSIERMDPHSNPIAASEDPIIRRLSYFLVHGIYMKLLVWPYFLCYDYSMDAVPLVHSILDVRLLLPLAGYMAFLQGSFFVLLALGSKSVARRRLAEGASVGVTIFLLSFLPMMNLLFPVGTLVAERLLYIPSIGSLVGFVCVAHLWSNGRLWRWCVAWLAMLTTCCVWWVVCNHRVLDWRSVDQITLVDGLKQLRSSRTQFNLANLYLMDRRLDEAAAAYKRSIATDPLERDSMPLYHLGQILLYNGQYQEAERYLHKAVTGYFSPLTLHEEEVWHDYGLALWHVGKAHDAIHNLRNSLITNPDFSKGYNNLACALVLTALSSPQPDVEAVREGLHCMDQAVQIMPYNGLYWRNAASLFAMSGDSLGAQQAWQQFQELDPGSAQGALVNGALPQDCVWEFYFR